MERKAYVIQVRYLKVNSSGNPLQDQRLVYGQAWHWSPDYAACPVSTGVPFVLDATWGRKTQRHWQGLFLSLKDARRRLRTKSVLSCKVDHYDPVIEILELDYAALLGCGRGRPVSEIQDELFGQPWDFPRWVEVGRRVVQQVWPECPLAQLAAI